MGPLGNDAKVKTQKKEWKSQNQRAKIKIYVSGFSLENIKQGRSALPFYV